ncbi:hypothetical protein ACIPRI_21245 [Variovorax sp. LARHSF232]
MREETLGPRLRCGSLGAALPTNGVHMSSLFSHSSVSLACAGLLALSACGGGSNGGGGNSSPAETPPTGTAPTTTPVEVKVIDGALSNALVFLDRNNNSALDTGEPSAKTDASGKASIDVPNEDVGKAPVVALVGTDAVDADTGPVAVPFTMRSPADRTGVISPLTTIVQRIVDDTGVTTTQAEAAAMGRTGMTSMLADYTLDSSAGGKEAALLARLMVLATQQQTAALAPSIGGADMGGGTITSADVDRAILGSMVRSVPDMAAAARGADLQAACAASSDAGCQSALQAQAAQINAGSRLSDASLPLLVAASRAPNPGPTAGQPASAGATLADLAFGDANNWYYRVFVATSVEATPNAQGMTHYREFQRANTNGALVEWGHGSSYARRNDMHWNGSAWAACVAGQQMQQTARDAAGRTADGNYCDGLEHSSSGQWSLDIGGRNMLDVALAIRSALPVHANWGNPPAGYAGNSNPDIASSVLPSGARLTAQASTVTSNALQYDAIAPVRVYSAAVAAGGDARANPSSACNSTEAIGSPLLELQTLEEILASNRGTPCLFNQGAINSSASPTPILSPDPNEWWGNSTLRIGIVGLAPVLANPTTFFTGNTDIRIAFPGGDAVGYYACQQRHINGSPRNCVPIGSGTYTIETLGDARVLRLTQPPAQAAWLDFERLFVERGGKVYYGSQRKLSTGMSLRLNLPATNAFFGQLGIPPVTP